MEHFRPRFDSLIFGTLASAVSAALAGLGVSSSAHAQEPVLEEITVTGSRIVRRDLDANSPIMTVDTERFQESSTIAMESVLNQLPQFTPAVTQFNVGSEFGVAGTSFFSEQLAVGATRTPGQATLSLRGLGPNRNLVLIDGKRGMPINPTMVIDTNSIPRSAVARVEVATHDA